jgi:hypothetical protein
MVEWRRGTFLACALGVALTSTTQALAQPSPWQLVNNTTGAFMHNPLLLTDGTVLMHAYCDGLPCTILSQKWYKLTPDINGSYINGTWSQAGSLPVINGTPYAPLWFASELLPDGRVIINGGLYNQNTNQVAYTNLGAIYDPIANAWSPVSPPTGWSHIGNAPSVVLPSGKYMLANCCAIRFGDSNSPLAAILDPSTMTWTATGSGKFDEYTLEGWTLLPGGNVLTVDAYVNKPNLCAGGTELYDPTIGAWSAGANTPSILSNCGTGPMGPAVLRHDSTVVAFGATLSGAVAPTAIYNT